MPETAVQTITAEADSPVYPTLASAGPTRRRRSSTPDRVLAEAVETARAGILQIAAPAQIGQDHQVRAEEDRLVTHLFSCTVKGYRGWYWFATLARVPRGKVATVCELGLIPGEQALLAPEWVPWADRVHPEEFEAERSEQEQQKSQAEESGESGEQRQLSATAQSRSTR